MKRTGYVHDNRYMRHETGTYHPDLADRLSAVYDGIKASGLLDQVTLLPAIRAELKWVQTVHDTGYIHRFEEVCLSGNSTFGYPDNQICADTFETAFLAVGGVIDAARRVMEGELDNAFCAVRPPGHHAESNQAMGFCYFNNVAVAARYVQQAHGVRRVGIIDFDVHHGNGTQHIFETDPTVFYYSIHQHPSFAFPGTGREFEVGVRKGAGFTKNSPVLPGQGDDMYRQLIEYEMMPILDAFKPQVIIASTGFDAHRDDEMSDISLTTEGYTWIMQEIMKLANLHAGGRIISVLEGGYCLERLGELAANHVRVLLEG
ncbi:MAG: histone deacetylase [Proteobacteria bacterium]|nr:MAG: histone deacetylase [Pseudomonadota bacterium]